MSDAPRIVALSGLPEVPWKDGKGRTREIAMEPGGDQGPGFLWRLSQAELECSGRFSSFPDVERIFTLLTSGPITQQVDGVTRTVEQAVPQEFPGEAEVSVTLSDDRAEKALNLMVFRNRVSGEVQTLAVSGTEEADIRGLVALVVVDGAVTVDHSNELGPLEAMIWEPGPRDPSGPSSVPVSAQGLGRAVVALVYVSYVDEKLSRPDPGAL